MIKGNKLIRYSIISSLLGILGFSFIENSFAFKDVSLNTPFYNAITYSANNGIVNKNAESFRTNDSITRYEALSILLKMKDTSIDYPSLSSYNSQFTDVPSNQWYTPYTNYSKNQGIISGYSDGTFKGNNPITRAEVAIVLQRLFNFSSPITKEFNDIGNLSSSMQDAINKMYSLGISKGNNGYYYPNSYISRGELVQLAYNSKKYIDSLSAINSVIPMKISSIFLKSEDNLFYIKIINTNVDSSLFTNSSNFYLKDENGNEISNFSSSYNPTSRLLTLNVNSTSSKFYLSISNNKYYCNSSFSRTTDNSNSNPSNSSGSIIPGNNSNTSSTSTGTTSTGTSGNQSSGTVSIVRNNLISSTIIPSGSAYNTLLSVTVKSKGTDSKITGFQLKKGGFISSSYVNGISVWIGNKRYGNVISSINTDGTVNISLSGDSNIINLPKDIEQIIDFKVNIGNSTDYNNISLSLLGITADKLIIGTFPINGQTINIVNGSGIIASYNLSLLSVGGGTNSSPTLLDIGQSADIGKIKVTVTNSKEDLVLNQMKLYVNGSLNDGDLTNVKLLSQEGNIIATSSGMVDRYLIFNIDNGYKIPRGGNKYFTVNTTISSNTSNSGRSFDLEVRDDSDVIATGYNSNAGILPTGTFSLSSSSYYFQINSGTLTISKAIESPNNSLGQGIDDSILATFDVKASGEDIELQKFNFYISTGSSTPTMRGTLYAKADGITIGTIDATSSNLYNSSIGAISGDLDNYYTIKAGATSKITLVGSTDYYVAEGSSYQVKLKSASYNGLSSDKNGSLDISSIAGNNRIIEATNLYATANPSFNPTNIVKGSSNIKIGSFNLQASNNEDINVTAINLGLSSSTGINNLKIKIGDKQIGTIISNPSASTNNLSIGYGNLVIPMNQTITIDVYGDISTAFNTGTLNTILKSNGVSAIGSISNNIITISDADINSTFFSVTNGGTLQITSNSSSPSNQILTAGLSQQSILSFNISADNNEDIRLDKLYFSTGAGNTATQLGTNITNIRLFDGNTQIGSTGYFNNNLVKFTGLNYTIPKGGIKTLTIKVDTTTSGILVKGSKIAIKPSYMEVTGISGGEVTKLGTDGSTSYSSITTGNSNLFTMEDVKPIITLASTSPSGIKIPSMNQEIAQYNIKAEGARNLNVKNIKITTAGSGSITNFELWYNNTRYSTGELSSSNTNGDITFNLSTPISITAGDTGLFIVKANTSNIRSGLNNTSSISFGTYIEGTTGGGGNITWDYNDINNQSSGDKTISDSYPIASNTLSY